MFDDRPLEDQIRWLAQHNQELFIANMKLALIIMDVREYCRLHDDHEGVSDAILDIIEGAEQWTR